MVMLLLRDAVQDTLTAQVTVASAISDGYAYAR